MRLYRHPRAAGVFQPPKLRNPDIDPDSVLEDHEAADVLGTSPATVAKLVEQGHLKTNPDAAGVPGIDPKSVKTFLGKLQPAQLADDTDEDQAPPVPPAAPQRPIARNPQTPAKPTAKPAPAADQDDDDLDAPDVLHAECPRCSEQLAIVGDVARAKCPTCGTTLTIARPVDEEDEEGDQDDETPAPKASAVPRGVLGIFRRIERGR